MLNVMPLKQLLWSEIRAYIAEYLKDASTSYDALEELKKRYGQPQVVLLTPWQNWTGFFTLLCMH